MQYAWFVLSMSLPSSCPRCPGCVPSLRTPHLQACSLFKRWSNLGSNSECETKSLEGRMETPGRVPWKLFTKTDIFKTIARTEFQHKKRKHQTPTVPMAATGRYDSKCRRLQPAQTLLRLGEHPGYTGVACSAGRSIRRTVPDCRLRRRAHNYSNCSQTRAHIRLGSVTRMQPGSRSLCTA